MIDNLAEFGYLVMEYCFFPFILFLLTFFSERKSDAETHNPIYKLRASGYEFVLIEAFSILSIFLRIHSTHGGETINIVLQVLAIVFVICLGLIFLFEIFKKKQEGVDAQTFRLTFYSSFIAWWLSILLLGAFTGTLLFCCGNTTMLYYPWVSLIVLLIASYIGFEKIVSRHFITPDVLFREFTSLSRRELYTKAQNKGLYIFNKYYKKEGISNYSVLMDVAIELGMSFFSENNETKNKKGEGIKVMTTLTSHPSFKENRYNDRFYMILAGLHCNRGEDDEALAVIRKHIKREQEKLSEYVKQKTFYKAFLIE